MANSKLLQKILSLVVLGFSLCAFQACGGDTDEVITAPTDDYGKITKNSLVATGGYRDVKPLRATILASINTIYQGAYSSIGIEFTPHQPNFDSSETSRVSSKSGVSNGRFETVLSYGDEGALKPGTTYYYRAYAYMAGTRYNGEVRSFDTPELQLSESTFVDMGLSVKWASCNMGAKAPETMGTLLQQCCAFKNFNGDFDDVPEGVHDDNWLGNSNYDVATRTLGSSYRIPREEEWEELENECIWTSGVCNGVKGFYISDKKDGTGVIFLPYVKKSAKHDITVYLSASPYNIKYLNKAKRLTEDFEYKMQLPTYTQNELCDIMEAYIDNMYDLKREMGVGEVLTENTHRYMDYGIILTPHSHINWSYVYGGYDDAFSESWKHPVTGKEYNFYDENKTMGGGVLYVRAVSNR